MGECDYSLAVHIGVGIAAVVALCLVAAVIAAVVS